MSRSYWRRRYRLYPPRPHDFKPLAGCAVDPPQPFRRSQGDERRNVAAPAGCRGEFVVPDNFFKWLFVPLSPTVCLCAHPEVNPSRLHRDGVAVINRLAIEASIDYYFARDLDHYPQ